MTRASVLHAQARMPSAEDNCAIATCRLEAGTRIRSERVDVTTAGVVPEGHRFAVCPIPEGHHLLSWGLPFGIANRDILPGEYVCNAPVLEELKLWEFDLGLPQDPNFRDLPWRPYSLEPERFQPAATTPPLPQPGFFRGYRRPGTRGVGTRNWIVVLGTSSRSAPFAQLLARRVNSRVGPLQNCDGVVAVAHTEGGGRKRPNNLELVLRTLAGFMVHPNVGAILAVDQGDEPVNNQALRQFMQQQGYPLRHVPHAFLTLKGSLGDALREGEAKIRAWLAPIDDLSRTRQSLSHLKAALQCGGSDAFSGISANPLAGWVAREIIRNGGCANLAETDELIGAESYMLARVRDLPTARRFLDQVARYQELAAWHGLTAEGNPSGGNRLRGLYNIALKSIGAAMKRHPDVRLDYVIDYATPMQEAGLYFMDSPGNDLESVAGQVAAGANLIIFTTGNGSITNFPFVPTLKVMTTTQRYQLLSREMDVNAGLYLDGTPMEELGAGMFELCVETASGQETQGEKAGHSQVSIWRDWSQTGTRRARQLQIMSPLPGQPLVCEFPPPPKKPTFRALFHPGGYASEQVNLILPTSLCSGQIAQMAAKRLNQMEVGRIQGISRTVALVHTEGCGSSGLTADAIYLRTLMGYLAHPNVAHALLLEHGCEKMHNARLQRELKDRGLPVQRYGYASVQLDGGIEAVLQHIHHWFESAARDGSRAVEQVVGVGVLAIGVLAGELPEGEAAALCQVLKIMLGCGATVVLPESVELLRSRTFADEFRLTEPLQPGLGYGQTAAGPGLYVMETPSNDPAETLTGLGATGVHLILVRPSSPFFPGHPLVPVVQFAAAQDSHLKDAVDCFLEGPGEEWPERLMEIVIGLASRTYSPVRDPWCYSAFQLARGPLGLSM